MIKKTHFLNGEELQSISHQILVHVNNTLIKEKTNQKWLSSDRYISNSEYEFAMNKFIL